MPVTRYVVDIEWENVTYPYGEDKGAADCGTVMTLQRVLDDAIKKGTLVVPETSIKATRAEWVSYVTNVQHDTWQHFLDGKALHPELRKSNGGVLKT